MISSYCVSWRTYSCRVGRSQPTWWAALDVRSGTCGPIGGRAGALEWWYRGGRGSPWGRATSWHLRRLLFDVLSPSYISLAYTWQERASNNCGSLSGNCGHSNGGVERRGECRRFPYEDGLLRHFSEVCGGWSHLSIQCKFHLLIFLVPSSRSCESRMLVTLRLY